MNLYWNYRVLISNSRKHFHCKNSRAERSHQHGQVTEIPSGDINHLLITNAYHGLVGCCAYFMPDPSQRETSSPCFSPVTADAIQSALVEVSLPSSDGHTIAQLLDELQLSMLAEPVLVPDGIETEASGSRYLHTDRYTDNNTPYADILFASGRDVDRYLNEHLPSDIPDTHREAVELAFRVYANKRGFDRAFEPPIVPLAIRVSDHDELILAEPGPYQPLPSKQSQSAN